MRIEVHKFGGTSVGSAERMTRAAALVERASRGARVVVVASAMSGITDRLLSVARAAERGESERVRGELAEIVSRHEAAREALGGEADAAGALPIASLHDELRRWLDAALSTRELSARLRDRIVSIGEKCSIRLLARALSAAGLRALPLDADTFLDTDAAFGEASPLSGSERAVRGALLSALDQGVIPVVTGFCGRAPDGSTTTLGRGGSDLSATVLAGALRADEVVIWTDVPGVFTADPRIVPEARTIPQLNYREAAELAYYGAKVLHQRTMIPVAPLGIPVQTLSSFDPSAGGTSVDRRFTPGSHPVKGISAISGQCLLSLEGNGMAGVPGVSARLFAALAAREISVTLISQSSSEASICIAVPDAEADSAEQAIKATFSPELSRGEIEEIVVMRGIGLVAAVGLGMARTPGVAARVFAALGRAHINVLAIAQGSSELNISLALHERDVPDAIRALHRSLGLHRQDPGVERPDGLDLVLLGCGKVGRALLSLVQERASRIEARFGLRPRVVGICDRAGYRFVPSGIEAGELEQLVSLKRSGGSFLGAPGVVSSRSPSDLVAEAARWRLTRPVLVDTTDAAHDAFGIALSAGFDVVTANKVPLAGQDEHYRALSSLAAENSRRLLAEATVGAGLPVMDTVEMLLATGDVIEQIEGCFSGTLGYVMTRLRQGVALSSAVREAMEAGYTEPDPAIDLSGTDVARKALILGRLSGLLPPGEPQISLKGICEASWVGLPREELFQRLSSLDEPLARRAAAAADRGCVLQFVARIRAGQIEVSICEIAAVSAVGALQGTDNLVVFTTERYRERPLVVQGPGAGVEVTAMGVLSDILRVAAERR